MTRLPARGGQSRRTHRGHTRRVHSVDGSRGGATRDADDPAAASAHA